MDNVIGTCAFYIRYTSISLTKLLQLNKNGTSLLLVPFLSVANMEEQLESEGISSPAGDGELRGYSGTPV